MDEAEGFDVDDIIIEDGGSDGNESITGNVDSREMRSFTNERQLDMLLADAPSNTLSNVEKFEVWKSLTLRLNEIGPPTHDWTNWRNKWYKLKSRTKLFEEDRSLMGDLEENPTIVVEELVENGEISTEFNNDPMIIENVKEFQAGNCDLEIKVLLIDLHKKMDTFIEHLQTLIEGVEDIKKIVKHKFQDV